ncbi:MAG: ComEC/Rec2 family competence protein, partial [Alphaproteobacteria bacterium]|nr:ComEC/Rec2 family competence protein [Alphaproteobacteria bacterium]
AAALLIGFGVARLRTEEAAAPVLYHRIGPVRFEARVLARDAHGKGTRLLLNVERIRRLAPAATPHRVRLSVRMAPDALVPGQWVSLVAVLMPPPAPSSPGGYDFGRWAWYEGIGAVGYAYGKAKPAPAPHPETLSERWSDWLEVLRDRMTARIESVIPGPQGAIAAALITGQRGGIAPEDQAAFRDAGLAHVLAISGLHLALAGGFFFWVVRALLALIPAVALRYPIKKWAAAAALLGAGVYLLISGSGAPAVRSFIMLSVMLGAILLDRPALSMRSVALAAALILLWRPESLIAPGFQMSFAAVTGLIALAEWERAHRKESGVAPGLLGRLRRYAVGIALTSVVAGLATAPFAVFHFDRASQYGLLGNLLAIPVVGLLVMPAATAAMVLMPFGLDRLPLVVMGKGVALMLAVARSVAHLPGAAAMVAVWPQAALLVVVFGGLWIMLWRAPWRWLGLLPIAAGLIVAGLATPPDILMTQDGHDVAVRLGDGKLAFLRPPKDDYAAQSWLQRGGDARDPKQAVATPSDGVRCDSYGCVAALADGEVLAAPLRFEALDEDCARAAIVIAAMPTRHQCNGPRLVLDRFDLAKNGATAIRLGSVLDIRTVRAERGRRPWSTLPERRYKRARRSHFNKRRFNSGG